MPIGRNKTRRKIEKKSSGRQHDDAFTEVHVTFVQIVSNAVEDYKF